MTLRQGIGHKDTRRGWETRWEDWCEETERTEVEEPAEIPASAGERDP